MGVPILIAISPPKEVAEKIIKIRKYITKKTGKSFYGSHDPHITLFVNTFPNFSDVEKKILSVIKKHKSFFAEIEGLHTFPLDPFFKVYTMVYKIEKTPEISKLQKVIIDKVNPLRTKDQAGWLLEKNSSPPKNIMKNIRKYGYPVGPEEWISHTTIDSVPKKYYDEIWKEIQKYDLNKKWKVNHISVFINLGEDGFKFFKKYKLK